jgi:hypothetical protein
MDISRAASTRRPYKGPRRSGSWKSAAWCRDGRFRRVISPECKPSGVRLQSIPRAFFSCSE